MEIMIMNLNYLLNFTFKIDLIVWKYPNDHLKWIVEPKFKIDLIVWKSVYHFLFVDLFYGLK